MVAFLRNEAWVVAVSIFELLHFYRIKGKYKLYEVIRSSNDLLKPL